ncbi:MAG: hypothetical protein ACR2K5_10065 [Pseudolabrys sp.]
MARDAAAGSFWLVGFVACYTLAFPLRLGVNGVWIGFTIGLLVYAVLLIWRFDALTRRGFMPALAHAPSPDPLTAFDSCVAARLDSR